MPNWTEILNEINATSRLDEIRRNYLKILSEYTGRNTIAYYSAFIERQIQQTSLDNNDMSGFMTTVQELDPAKGLDLILHTPGGSPSAAESIINYLRSIFKNDIRVIVPHMAMSAGTLMACAAKEIIMGYHSSLGPVDPQFNGIPAFNIVDEYNDACSDLAQNPANLAYWRLRLEKLPAAFVKLATDAISLSDVLVENWLRTGMFADLPDDETTAHLIQRIKKSLNEHADSKTHDRHFDINKCRSFGLKIKALEDDPTLQDKVLSVHHAYTHTIAMTSVAKLIENNEGKAFIFLIKT